MRQLSPGSGRQKIPNLATKPLVMVLLVALVTLVGTPRPAAAGDRPAAADIGIIKAAGVRQQLDCQGSGPVTLLVIAGLGAPASTWAPVADQLRGATRTCFYDRPGLGKSPARPQSKQIVDAGLYARELTALLLAAGEPGPYVVVGHSFGGLIARAFVRQNLSAVSAVLLAESVDPADKSTGTYWREAGHAVNMRLSQSAAGGGPKLGRLPLLVLSASNPERDHLGGPTYGQPASMIRQWVAQQRADVHLSTNSIQVIAKSGHVLQQDAPEAVVEAAKELVQSATQATPLACSDIWASLDATCR